MARIPERKQVLEARGSRRAKSRMPAGTVKAAPPPMPAWLSPLAKKIWRATVAAVKSAWLLSPADGGILTSFVLAVEEVQTCSERLAVEGLMVESHGQKYPHPLLKTRAAAEQRVKALGAELGLTPLSRRRGHVDTAIPVSADPFDRFLSGRSAGVPFRRRTPADQFKLG